MSEKIYGLSFYIFRLEGLIEGEKKFFLSYLKVETIYGSEIFFFYAFESYTVKFCRLVECSNEVYVIVLPFSYLQILPNYTTTSY